MSPKPGPETTHCPFCDRKKIVVDRRTGWRENHFRRSGRKGGRCAGSNRHIDTTPEART